jgi:hypothetical protein
MPVVGYITEMGDLSPDLRYIFILFARITLA